MTVVLLKGALRIKYTRQVLNLVEAVTAMPRVCRELAATAYASRSASKGTEHTKIVCQSAFHILMSHAY